jgi:lysophospholipase L1-like esterase
MKRILVFGDSNSWGHVPGTDRRYGPEVRWPRAMAAELGTNFEIIEECLCGRTTVFDDPVSPGRNGLSALPILLESHAPLDLVTIALGCNDLQPHFSASAYHSAKGAGMLVELVQKSAGLRAQAQVPQVLLVAPSLVSESARYYESEVMAGAEAKSKEMARHYRAKAKELGCHFLAAAPHAQPSAIDGVHLDEKGHLALARAVAKEVAQILGEETAG